MLSYNDTLPSSSRDDYSQTIRKHYLGNEKLSHDNFDELVNMAGDRLFKYDIQIAARLQADKSGNEKMYFVKYAYANGTRSFANILAKDFTVAFGAGHGDDQLIFLDNAVHTNLSADELEMSKNFIELYDSFGHEVTSPHFGDFVLEPIIPG